MCQILHWNTVPVFMELIFYEDVNQQLPNNIQNTVTEGTWSPGTGFSLSGDMTLVFRVNWSWWPRRVPGFSGLLLHSLNLGWPCDLFYGWKAEERTLHESWISASGWPAGLCSHLKPCQAAMWTSPGQPSLWWPRPLARWYPKSKLSRSPTTDHRCIKWVQLSHLIGWPTEQWAK